jgi:hypothetical protein
LSQRATLTTNRREISTLALCPDKNVKVDEMALETAQNEFHSSTLKMSPKQRFAIAAFPNWAELFQHLQSKHAGIRDVEPCGLIGLQQLWPPERRFDIGLLERLGSVARFTLHNPLQSVFCSGDLVRPLTSNLVGAGGCSLVEILQHWVAPVQAERLSNEVSKGHLILWTSAKPHL